TLALWQPVLTEDLAPPLDLVLVEPALAIGAQGGLGLVARHRPPRPSGDVLFCQGQRFGHDSPPAVRSIEAARLAIMPGVGPAAGTRMELPSGRELRALGARPVQVDRVDRGGRGDEQPVALGAAERAVRHDLGDPDKAQPSAVGGEAVDAVPGAAPEVVL